MTTRTDTTEDVIFDRETNRIARAVFIKGNESQVTPEVRQSLGQLPYKLSEMLMHHEGICFSVYGENIVASLLFRYYGPRGLQKLIEQGAIKFCLETTMVVHWEKARKGLYPLAPLQLTTAPHCDPESSIQTGIGRLPHNMESRAWKRLKRDLADAYVTPAKTLASGGIEFAYQG